MSEYLNRCHFGDVRDVLRRMIADGVKVNCIVTSPPYWGLRSYLPAGHADKPLEIGSEPTLKEFIATMTEVFMLAREVLADDGTCWINMGDSYTSGGRSTWRSGVSENKGHEIQNDQSRPGTPEGLKSKDLMGQPWRLAFALQDAGWWLRQDIIWHKPNPMPESTKDRCTKAHEYIFLLSKSERYYFDQGAIRTPLRPETKALSFETMDYKARDRYKMPDGWNTGEGAHGSFHPEGREKGKKAGPNAMRGQGSNRSSEGGKANRDGRDMSEIGNPDSANKRSVWTVATEAYPGSHYATFPRALIEPCILAGAPAGGTVLDIFMGSGTTAQVAEQLGRKWIGIDIDERNDALQRERLRQPSLDLEAA